jgi:hypothetical protein
VAALQSGRGDGSWTGSSGITSTAVASALAQGVSRSVGWLDNGNGAVSFAYAAPGDTNVDNQVDVLDAANFLSGSKFDTGLPANWLEGDFNYDGMTDVLDAASFLTAELFDAGPYTAASGTLAAVPEPNMLGLAGVVLAVLGWMAAKSAVVS